MMKKPYPFCWAFRCRKICNLGTSFTLTCVQSETALVAPPTIPRKRSMVSKFFVAVIWEKGARLVLWIMLCILIRMWQSIAKWTGMFWAWASRAAPSESVHGSKHNDTEKCILSRCSTAELSNSAQTTEVQHRAKKYVHVHLDVSVPNCVLNEWNEIHAFKNKALRANATALVVLHPRKTLSHFQTSTSANPVSSRDSANTFRSLSACNVVVCTHVAAVMYSLPWWWFSVRELLANMVLNDRLECINVNISTFILPRSWL